METKWPLLPATICIHYAGQGSYPTGVGKGRLCT